MTTPNLGVPSNPHLQLAVRALPGYVEALELVEQADHWLRQQPAIAPVDPSLRQRIDDQWIDAEQAHAAAMSNYESKRRIVQQRRQQESGRAQSILTSGSDLILSKLSRDLTELLAEAAGIVTELGGATTAAEAVAVDAGQQWKQLTELAGDYQSIRNAQEFTMLKGSYATWKSVTPAMPGDDHANLAFIRNLDDLWPSWRQPGMRTRRVELGNDAPTPKRDEPWPRNEYGPEMLVWLVSSDAQPWIATSRQLRELWAELDTMPDVDDHQDDDESRFDNRLLGPQVARRQQQHGTDYSRIAPAIDSKPRPKPPELQEVTR